MVPKIVPRPAGKEPGTSFIHAVGDPSWIILGLFLVGCFIIWWLNGY